MLVLEMYEFFDLLDLMDLLELSCWSLGGLQEFEVAYLRPIVACLKPKGGLF